MTDSDLYSPRQALIDAFSYARQNARALFAGALLSAAVGLAAYFWVSPQYRAKATLRCYVVKASSTAGILTALEDPIRDRDTQAVARALGLRPATVAGLRKLDISLPKYIQPEDANEVLDVFITADVTRHELFDSLEVALPRYVRSAPLVDSLMRWRTAVLAQTERGVIHELGQLDSLRSQAGVALRQGKNAEALGDLSGGEAAAQMYNLRRDVRFEQQRVRQVFMVSRFVVPSRPFYPRLLWFVAVPAALGLLLSLVFIEVSKLWRASA